MTTNNNDLSDLEMNINSKKVGDMVIDALQEILPHVRSASTADIMMAYAVMIKSTLIGMDLSETERAEAKALFDQIYPKVLVDHVMPGMHTSTAIH